MADKIVSSFYFFQHGKEIVKSKKFQFKTTGKIATSATIIGLSKYQIDQHGIENQNDIEGYIGYMMRELNDPFKRKPIAITGIGMLDLANASDLYQYHQYANQLAEAFSKDGNLAWCPIVSLDGFELAKDMHLFRDEDYAAVFTKALPNWFKQVGLDPNNMLWTASYHNNTDNPHVHVLFVEKQQTRSKGTFQKQEINAFRLELVKAMNQRVRAFTQTDKHVQSIQEKYMQLDLQKSLFKQDISTFLSKKLDHIIQKDIVAIYQKINRDQVKGKLMINAYAMKDYRSDIHKVVEKILQHPSNKNQYESLQEIWKQLDKQSKGNLVQDANAYYRQEDKKLKDWIANQILQDKKYYDQSVQSSIQDVLQKDSSIPEMDIPIHTADTLHQTDEKANATAKKVRKQIAKIYRKQDHSNANKQTYKSNIIVKTCSKLTFNLSAFGKSTQKQLDKYHQEMEEKAYDQNLTVNR